MVDLIDGTTPQLVDTVTELWFRVSQADGAAGFVPTDTREDIRVVAAAVAHARAIGVERLELSTRSGHGLEAFYTSQGWTERGRWPGAVRVAEGDERDDIWFTREL